MTGRLLNRLNAALERYLPEKRLFLRSNTETRFIRLRPLTQALGLGGSALVLAWTIIATAILFMDSIGSGSVREQARREQIAYEARLNTLSYERDRRAEEAATAHERFNIALEQISRMQSALLASEDVRKEMETGIDVIQSTLRQTIKERDTARREAAAISQTLAKQTGSARTDAGRAKDVEDTLDFLANALSSTAGERDQLAAAADQARQEAEVIALEKRLLEDRNHHIFTQLEEAVTISMEPLDKMFRAAGMSTEKVLQQVKRGYSGMGGPLTPLSYSTKGDPQDSDTLRANAILESVDRINLYRLAAAKMPFANPVKSSYRFTSGFGTRRDPIRGGSRMHSGIDFAGAYGTPIYATGDGVVTHAGWDSGYGRLVTIKHDFGIETRYAHMSQVRVKVGQKVSRGDRIGDMGNSGRSTGTHLHYEVRVNSKAVNPMTYIQAAKDIF